MVKGISVLNPVDIERDYLGFTVLEYSLVFGIAILGGAGVNLYLTRLSDRKDKVKLMYVAA